MPRVSPGDTLGVSREDANPVSRDETLSSSRGRRVEVIVWEKNRPFRVALGVASGKPSQTVEHLAAFIPDEKLWRLDPVQTLTSLGTEGQVRSYLALH